MWGRFKKKKKELEVNRIAVWNKYQAIKTMKCPEHWMKLFWLEQGNWLSKLMIRQEEKKIDLNVEVMGNEIN